MKILVTGGGGFIGSALITELLKEGHSVISYSRSDYPFLREQGVEVVRGDLADRDFLKIAAKGCDVIFHVAAKAGFWGDYQEYYRTNVHGTKNIIEACLLNDIEHLIFTSSASVVFDGRDINGSNESIPYPRKHRTPYTETKMLSEKMVLKANNEILKTLSLRPHLVWGPGDNHIIPRLLAQAKAGKLRQIGTGENIIDTTYIDNAVQAHICAMKTIFRKPEACGKAYFISDDEPVKLWEFVNEILIHSNYKPISKQISEKSAMIIANLIQNSWKLFGIKKEPRITPFLVEELSRSHWFDIRAAKELLDYHPQISINEGLKMLRKSSK